MTALTSVAFVQARGTPFELGRVHGSRLAARLRGFLDDGLCRLNLLLREPVSLASLRPQLDAYGAALQAGTPRLYAEVQGLAAGAGLTLHEALLLQTRREIMGYQRVPTMGDCTTYTRVDAQDPPSTVLAQTIDLTGNLDDVLGVLRLADPARARESLVVSFGGLLGYLGVNSDGLAIGINLVLGGQWRPGVPPYLVIRHLLDTTGSVDEALAALRELTIAGSRTLTFCDPTKAAFVEILDGELRVVESSQTCHTNHYLCPDFAPRDELNLFARNSSVRRLDTCRARLAQLDGSATAEEHFGLLAQPPVAVPDHGDIRTERTVGAVVIFPDRRELHLRPGDPARSGTQVFRLDALESGASS